MPVAYKWHPIEDLGDDPKSLTDGELESLKRVWMTQKGELSQSGALDEFDKRLRREWAIETGIIEGVYTLDRGVTKTLIEKGIEAALIPHGASNRDPELVARIIQDHFDTLEGMFDFVGGQRKLTVGYIKELHAALLRNQDTYTVVDRSSQAFEKPLEKGTYKNTPNSPTRPDGLEHQYCAPEHVASEMDELVRMHAQHESSGVPVEVEAAWLHHRFTQIHPFADGNGRVARAVASLVFIKAGWFPLIVNRDHRTRYIEALEKADDGDLSPLIAMCVESQRNALLQATEVAYDVKLIASVPEAIAAARDRLQRIEVQSESWSAAKDTANDLFEVTRERFAGIGTVLTGGTSSGFGFQRAVQKQPEYDDVRMFVVRKTGQVADFSQFYGLAELTLDVRRNDILELLFYAVGPRYRGFIGVIAYLLLLGTEPILINRIFLINYEEARESAQTRFASWLERVIVEGLNEWRRTL